MPLSGVCRTPSSFSAFQTLSLGTTNAILRYNIHTPYKDSKSRAQKAPPLPAKKQTSGRTCPHDEHTRLEARLRRAGPPPREHARLGVARQATLNPVRGHLNPSGRSPCFLIWHHRRIFCFIFYVRSDRPKGGASFISGRRVLRRVRC